MVLKQRLAEMLLRAHPQDAARALEPLDVPAQARVLAAVEAPVAAAVLQQMVPHAAAHALTDVSPERAADIIDALPTTNAAALLRRMPEDSREGLIDTLHEERARRLRLLLQHRESTAGAIADPDVLVLTNDITVADALSIHGAALIEATYELPVVDQEQKLVGVVSLPELSRADKAVAVGAIMAKQFPALPARGTVRAALAHPAWESSPTLPVVDAGGVFVGLVRYETLRQIARSLQDPSTSELSTSRALGELFGTAVGGMFEALVGVSGDKPR